MRYINDKIYFSKDEGGSLRLCILDGRCSLQLVRLRHRLNFFEGAFSSNHHPAGSYAAYSDDASGVGSSYCHRSQAMIVSTVVH